MIAADRLPMVVENCQVPERSLVERGIVCDEGAERNPIVERDEAGQKSRDFFRKRSIENLYRHK